MPLPRVRRAACAHQEGAEQAIEEGHDVEGRLVARGLPVAAEAPAPRHHRREAAQALHLARVHGHCVDDHGVEEDAGAHKHEHVDLRGGACGATLNVDRRAPLNPLSIASLAIESARLKPPGMSLALSTRDRAASLRLCQ